MLLASSTTNVAQKLMRFILQHFIYSSSSRKTNANNSTNSKFSHKCLSISMEGCLLKSCSTFPYFMVVALEAGGGGLLRGLLLLMSYPFICILGNEIGTRFMVMLTFCGLRKESLVRVGRAILPKHLLEDVGLQGFEMLKKMENEHGRVICVSRMPRVMVEAFLREYLEVEYVLGRELKVLGGFYTGFMQGEGEKVLQSKDGSNEMISSTAFVNSQLPLSSYCKEILSVDNEEKKRWQVLPRERYPKPLIFHDGRLAFRPTPLNTLSMFLWLPFGFILALLRLIVSLSLPYKLSTPILAMTNMKWRLLLHTGNGNGSGEKPITISESPYHHSKTTHKRGQLFVSNHRTLIDPIYISMAINQPVQAVCYSLSRVSEILSPISTVRLTRNREEDATIMKKLLDRGESVVVCPEGTTCRQASMNSFGLQHYI